MTKNSNGMYSPIFSLKQQILTSIVTKSRGEEGRCFQAKTLKWILGDLVLCLGTQD